MTQKISFHELNQRVTKFGWELQTTEEEWKVRNSKSNICVRSPQYFKQDRPVALFGPKAVTPPSCLFARQIRKGETMMVLIAAKLLDVYMIREYTPPCLKQAGYRLDGFAVLEGKHGAGVQLAMEHQGDHRVNPKAPIHMHKGGAQASMSYWKEADARKASLLEKAGIVLVKVPDILQATSSVSGAVDLVAQALEKSLPWLLGNQNYLQRKQDLCNGEQDIGFPATWEEYTRARVEAALKASGDDLHLQFVSADALSGRVTLRCAAHGVLPSAQLNNVLGAADGSRVGTRCPFCAIEKRASAKRLPFAQVLKVAQKAGFNPLFEEHEYTNNNEPLPWQCMKDATHKMHTSLAHLSERGCAHCRQDATALVRCEDEFAQASRLVQARGDTMLSSAGDYQDQNSPIRYLCSLCGQECSQKISKIKVGQRHGCQRLSASQATRRLAEFEKFKAACAAAGVTILASAQQYQGYRHPLQYQRQGDSAIHKAAPYWITNRLLQPPSI